MVTVKTEEIANNSRMGMDLILAIDTSGSMSGTKIKLVKETLNFLVEELKEIDRLCLIEFNNEMRVLTGLSSMNKKNKTHFKKVIKRINAGGSTNIKAAIDQAMKIICDRKETNELTSIMLLSDGQDTFGNNHQTITQSMASFDKQLQK